MAETSEAQQRLSPLGLLIASALWRAGICSHERAIEFAAVFSEETRKERRRRLFRSRRRG